MRGGYLGRFIFSSKKNKYLKEFEDESSSFDFGVQFHDKIRYFGKNVFYLNCASGDGGALSCVDFRRGKYLDGIGFYGLVLYKNRIYVGGVSFCENGEYKDIPMASYNLDFKDRKSIIVKKTKGKKWDNCSEWFENIDKKYIYCRDSTSNKIYKYRYQYR